jgi:multidrug efflux pump
MTPRFTDRFILRPVMAIVVSILILLAGLAALLSLPVREYPDLESATIVIDTSFPGATQEVMQGFVTAPITQAIATASGIDYVTSKSTQGRSEVKAKLVLNANSDRALTEVLSRVEQVKYRLPEGVSDPIVSKITDGASAVQYIAFTSDTMGMPAINDFVERVAQPMLTSIPGVAQAQSIGGSPLAMRVWVDPVRLAARGLTAADLAAALRSNNVQAAPGQLKTANTLTAITASTDARSVDEFRKLVVKSTPDGLVRLGDVADVELGGQNYTSLGRTGGRPAVMIAIDPTADGNPLDIVREVNRILPEIQRAAPPGLHVASSFDIAHFVNASIRDVKYTLLEAIVIVVLLIFLFLGSYRAVLIPVVTIPLSLVGTAAIMLPLGFSLNLLTLLAMVLAIGLVVDDAIVVVENIHRHIEDGMPRIDAALLGAREIIGPVFAMTITLAAVYTPIGLMSGLTGALFREFALTLAGAVIVSGIVALTLSPMMSSRLLETKSSEGRMARAAEHYLGVLSTTYERLLARTLDMRAAVLAVAGAVLLMIGVLFLGSQRELAPQEDKGYIFTSVKAPQYASIEYTKKVVERVQDLFTSLPEYTNSFFAGGFAGENFAFGGVILSEWGERDRSAMDILAQMQSEVGKIVGASATPFEPAPLPASTEGLPFQMVMRSSKDFREIYDEMEALKAKAFQSGLFAFVDSDLAFDSPSVRITIDHAKAGDLGISMQTIADTLALLLGENYVNRFNYFDRSYDVIPQVREKDRLSPDNLGRFYVRAQSGELLPLSTIIRTDVTPAPNSLPQFNLMNSATLSAVLRPGVTMGKAVAFMEKQAAKPGISLDWLADSRQYVQEGNRLVVSFGFALVVIFLVLAAQYESFRDPLIILVTVPLAICGALLPLYLGFTTLNIYTQIGLVTLIGLISKHGILMVAFANDLQRRENNDRRTAILTAARVRMRPILMTTAAMVAGLIPLLFATGAGAASRFAIGIVVVMGMLVGTLFTLFVLPTFYTLFAEDHRPKAAETEKPRVVSTMKRA